MPNRSKQKGDRFERLVVELLQSYGLSAEKVPLSGAVKTNRFDHDISCPVRGIDTRLECKSRARAFGTLYKMLGNNGALVVKDDRCEPMVVMTLAKFAELAK